MTDYNTDDAREIQEAQETGNTRDGNNLAVTQGAGGGGLQVNTPSFDYQDFDSENAGYGLPIGPTDQERDDGYITSLGALQAMARNQA